MTALLCYECTYIIGLFLEANERESGFVKRRGVSECVSEFTRIRKQGRQKQASIETRRREADSGADWTTDRPTSNRDRRRTHDRQNALTQSFTHSLTHTYHAQRRAKDDGGKKQEISSSFLPAAVTFMHALWVCCCTRHFPMQVSLALMQTDRQTNTQTHTERQVKSSLFFSRPD